MTSGCCDRWMLALAIPWFLCTAGMAQQGGQHPPPGPALGGPDGVEQEIAFLDSRASLSEWRLMPGYFDWKQQLTQDHGLSYGLSNYLLYQRASHRVTSRDGFGGIFRFQGAWQAIGRGTGNPGTIQFRVEHRTALHSGFAPQELGADIGAVALNTGFAYGDDFDVDLSVINWTQGLLDRRFGFAVGRLAFDVYQDAFVFQTFSRGFLNRGFLVNPTIGTTGIGALGAVAKGFVNDQFWAGGQIYDGNAVSGDFDIDTVEEGEWLKSVEVGWTPSIDRYKLDRIQFTYWHKDALRKKGVRAGEGWAVSASHQVNAQTIVFTRFGHSDGGAGVAARNAASAGFEFAPVKSQKLNFGFGWADPSDTSLRDEYVLETSYQVQVTPQFSITPDLQLLLDPANDPTRSEVWVFGVRGILAF